jgi:hypothetical protein
MAIVFESTSICWFDDDLLWTAFANRSSHDQVFLDAGPGSSIETPHGLLRTIRHSMAYRKLSVSDPNFRSWLFVAVLC